MTRRNTPPSTPHPVAPAGNDTLSEERIAEARRMFESDALEAEYAGQANALRVARTGLAALASLESLRAENASLKELLADLTNVEMFNRLRAENARLREEAEQTERDYNGIVEDVVACGEQLWDALSSKQHEYETTERAYVVSIKRAAALRSELSAANAEVARLRGIIAEVRHTWVLRGIVRNDLLETGLAPPGSESQKKGDG